MDFLDWFFGLPGWAALLLGGIFSLALLMLALSFLSAARLFTKANGPWGRLARRTGLTFQPGRLLFPQRRPVVSGTYQGRPLKLEWLANRRSNITSYYTRLRRPVEHGENFRIAPSNIFDRAGELLGRGDFKVGDPEFDKAVAIRSSSDTFISFLLADEDLRYRLRKIPKWDELRLNRDGLSLTLRGIFRDVNALEELFALTGDLADRIERYEA